MSDEVSSVASSLGAGVKEVYDTLIDVGNSSVSDGSTIIEMDVRGPKGGGGGTNKLLLGLAGAVGLGVATVAVICFVRHMQKKRNANRLCVEDGWTGYPDDNAPSAGGMMTNSSNNKRAQLLSAIESPSASAPTDGPVRGNPVPPPTTSLRGAMMDERPSRGANVVAAAAAASAMAEPTALEADDPNFTPLDKLLSA